MAFTNRHAPEDTAIKQEALTENIDIRGVGRYYPEEYSGQIQAMANRKQLIADVPKTLAGIVLDYDEHALSTWKANQEVQLNDKATVNHLLLNNRKQQMELESDLEIYDAQKELESQIFQARKNVTTQGGRTEEQAVADVVESFKDRFQGRLIPDQKWQKILQETGLRSAAQARLSDFKTNVEWANFAIQNEFNDVFHAVTGTFQNPDGSFQPIMDIQTGMDMFVKKISPLIQHTEAIKRPEILQAYYNQMIQGQAGALVELYRDGQINAETVMTMLQGMRTEYGGQAKEWTFTDDKGQPLKDTEGNEIKIDLSLNPDTELVLLKAYKDAKNGIGNGGEVIVSNAIDDFKQAVGWDDIQNQGWSKQLLARNLIELDNLFISQMANILNSTASDNKKAESINDLYRIFNTCYMLTSTKELITDMGSDALTGIRMVIRDINSNLQANRSNANWQNYQGTYTINGKTYSLGSSPMGEELRAVAFKSGIDLNIVAPKLGNTNEDAALYWEQTAQLLEKYANYISKNNIGEVLNITDKNFRNSTDTAVRYLTVDQIFKHDKTGKTIDINTETAIAFQEQLKNMKAQGQKYNSRRFVPISTIDSMLGKIGEIEDPIQQWKAKEFIGKNFQQAGLASDLYVYAWERMQQGKDDGGILSIIALSNSENGYAAFQNAIQSGTFQTIKSQEKTTLVENITKDANRIIKDLGISTKDANMHRQLTEWCALAAYDPINKNVDTAKFKTYFKEALSSQYVNLKYEGWQGIKNITAPTAFANKSVYKFHPALIPYANDIDRLRSIGSEIQKQLIIIQRLAKLQAYPQSIQSLMKDTIIEPDIETGMFKLTKANGMQYTIGDKQIGAILDDKLLFNRVSPKDIAQLNLNILMSSLLTQYSNDIFKEKEKKLGFVSVPYSLTQHEMKEWKSEEEFNKLKTDWEKKQYSFSRLGDDPQKLYMTLLNYSNSTKRGGIYNIEKYKITDEDLFDSYDKIEQAGEIYQELLPYPSYLKNRKKINME